MTYHFLDFSAHLRPSPIHLRVEDPYFITHYIHFGAGNRGQDERNTTNS